MGFAGMTVDTSLTSDTGSDATNDLRIPATVFSQAGRNDGAFRHAGLDPASREEKGTGNFLSWVR